MQLIYNFHFLTRGLIPRLGFSVHSMYVFMAWCLSTGIFLMMEAENTSETSVNFYQATLRNNPEDSLATVRTWNLTLFLSSATRGDILCRISLEFLEQFWNRCCHFSKSLNRFTPANSTRTECANSSRAVRAHGPHGVHHMIVGCSIVQSYSMRTAMTDEYHLASVTPIFWQYYLLLSSIFVFQFLLYLCLNYTRSCTLDRSSYFSSYN
jgi:hypothetical protein